MEKGGKSILVVSSNHLRSKFYNQLIQLWLQAFHSAVAKITKTTVPTVLQSKSANFKNPH